VWRLTRCIAEKRSTPDQRIAWLSDRQHGVVTIGQLHGAGLSDDAVLGRVRSGRLHRVYRGVYAVGHRRLPVEGRWMAAVSACGEGAALSHRSAAALWALVPRSGPAVGAGGPIDVVVPFDRRPTRRKGIRIHRSRSLPPGSIVRRDEIPVTNPARTIADMRRSASASEMRSMVRKAEVLGLRTELAPRAEPTRSELEDLFLDFWSGTGSRHRTSTVKSSNWRSTFPGPSHAHFSGENSKEGLTMLACATGERRTKRGKDTGRPNSSAIWPTEDAAPRRVRRRQARAQASSAPTTKEPGRAREPALRRGRRGGRGRAGRRRGTSAG
jgi:putative AbiEi antitoxin of type IV toxin-antitoxin system